MRLDKLPGVVLAGVIAFFGSTSARADGPIQGEVGLRAANAAEVQDFLAADVKGLGSLWSDGFVVTNPFNRFVGKAAVLSMVESGMLRFSTYERNIEYIKAYDNIAVVAGSETTGWAGTLPLAGKTSHLRFTAVWQRSGKGWLEIARHANIVADR